MLVLYLEQYPFVVYNSYIHIYIIICIKYSSVQPWLPAAYHIEHDNLKQKKKNNSHVENYFVIGQNAKVRAINNKNLGMFCISKARTNKKRKQTSQHVFKLVLIMSVFMQTNGRDPTIFYIYSPILKENVIFL